MRLYKGHDINQVSQELKDAVPEEIKQQARDMARAELAKKLAEIGSSLPLLASLLPPTDAGIFQISRAVKRRCTVNTTIRFRLRSRRSFRSSTSWRRRRRSESGSSDSLTESWTTRSWWKGSRARRRFTSDEEWRNVSLLSSSFSSVRVADSRRSFAQPSLVDRSSKRSEFVSSSTFPPRCTATNTTVDSSGPTKRLR